MDDSENDGRDAGTVAYDLRKEKRIRGGQRGATTRLLKRGAELLAGDVVDAVEVEHVKTSLQGKVTVLKALDEAILNGMGEDEDIEREIDDADRLQCDVLLCIAKLKAAVVQSNVEESQSAAVPVPVVLSPVLAAAPTASSSSHSVTRATNESLAEDSTHQSVSTPEGYSTPQLEVQLQLTGDRNESKAVSWTRLADPLESQANPDSAQVPREPIDECTIHAIREGLSEAHEKAGSPGIMVSSAPMTRSMSVASNHEEAMSYNLRLPKLKLRSYDGNLAEWTTFWDMYTTSVHNNPKIATIDKFSYLKSVQPKPVTVSAATVNSPAEDIGNVIDSNVFGTYTRLIRVTATMLLVVDRMKKRSDSKTPMTAHLRRAEELWILAAQKSIKSDAKLTKTVKQLDVREEESGVLRCGGRLQNALISEGAKYPILLPTEHHVTNLIIMDCHQRMMHGGSKATLAEVREKFWIVRGRQVVKKLIGRCVICRRHEGKPLRGPLAPPLPPFRIQQAPAFQNIGLDNASPLFVNGSEKVWILLFTCCVTRAIHLELVESLSTDAFLRAMRRFTARRGVPSFIVSDNAQTFKAASKFLNRVGQQTIQWSFNLPRAPWWGGVFERLIRSVKRCLRKVVGGARLTRDELNTVVTEVEMVINARPLGYVGMTSDDMEPPLTPSHLLHGRRISQMAEEPVEAADDPDFSIPESNTATLDKRMKHMKMVMHHFWSRWQKEYVLELRTACKNSSKFSKYPSDVSKGDVVIIYDKEQPRGSWKTGIVERLHEGADGKCRSADVRVINSQGKAVTFQRAVQHLYPLELSCNEPENEQEKPEDPKEIEQQPTRQSRAAAKAARSSVKQLKELGLV